MYAIIISALTYTGAFIYPNYLGVGVLFWMLPLIVTSQDNNVGLHDGFKAGCAWGLIFFSAHLYWVAKRSIVAYIAIVCYFAIISGLWLWFKKLIVYRWVRNIQNHNGKCAALCCTWVISTVTFICITCYCSMAIFDCFEGYPLANPLLPLVSWTWYMRPICYFGTIGYWIIIVIINVVLARLFIKCDTNTLIFLMAIIAFPAMFQPPAQKIIMNKNDFFYIQPTWNNNSCTTLSEKFYTISRIIDANCCGKDMRYIVLPEGSFDGNLIAWEKYIDAWTSLLPSKVSIFIGAYRKDESALYNSLYHIQDGKIIAWYDKEHLMFFGERRPWIAEYLMTEFCALFGKVSFSYPINNQSHITMDGLQPMICSELFCKEKTPPVHDRPILFVCHDGWFNMRYAQDLAYRCAKLYSLRYQVPIIYVGSSEMHIIE